MDPELIARCRNRLIEVARQRGTITYGHLASHLGIANRGSWDMLDEIYNKETAAGRPDLTLLVVKAATGYPPYFSRGGPARSVRFDPTKDLQPWAAELTRVYQTWAQLLNS